MSSRKYTIDSVRMEVTVVVTLPNGQKVTVSVPQMQGDFSLVNRVTYDAGELGGLRMPSWNSTETLEFNITGHPMQTSENSQSLWLITQEASDV